MFDKTAMSLISLEQAIARPTGEDATEAGALISAKPQSLESRVATKKVSGKRVAKVDWVKQQKQSRDQLKSLSQQKKRLRLQTLHKTFNKDVIRSQEKLEELEKLVGRIQEKVKSFSSIVPAT